ncbi:MAG TPA: hypothetical protein VJ976_02455 [Ornithinimicrobium sp.]|uniref:hypothetical protein n=1 Tax=Ornithinimicrobium sp. TaxID=1977084 RepID=UPI002B46FE21|nr:hypothetical protein [Ornithinimicrobium sp.]HKJ11232.1 hypothetical protein [Ornithinimicrobium sp.]
MEYVERVQRRAYDAAVRAHGGYDRWVRERERGDVPGWVMITVMTAGLVVALGLIARPLLESVFTNAVNSVTGP